MFVRESRLASGSPLPESQSRRQVAKKVCIQVYESVVGYARGSFRLLVQGGRMNRKGMRSGDGCG